MRAETYVSRLAASPSRPRLQFLPLAEMLRESGGERRIARDVRMPALMRLDALVGHSFSPRDHANVINVLTLIQPSPVFNRMLPRFRQAVTVLLPAPPRLGSNCARLQFARAAAALRASRAAFTRP